MRSRKLNVRCAVSFVFGVLSVWIMPPRIAKWIGEQRSGRFMAFLMGAAVTVSLGSSGLASRPGRSDVTNVEMLARRLFFTKPPSR